MESLLRIILIEDVETDAELIQRELKKAGVSFTATVVETAAEFEQAIQAQMPDVILSDYTLPRFSALEALNIKKRLIPDIPFILVTGAQTEEIAVNSIKAGADDYLLKSSLARLSTAVLNTLRAYKQKKEQQQVFQQLTVSEEKYRNLFEGSLIGMLRWRLSDGRILERNKKAEAYTQLFCDDNNLFHDCFLNQDDYTHIVQTLKEQGIIEHIEFAVKSKQTKISWLSLSAKLFDGDQIVEGTLQDISASKESIIELEKVNYELDRFVYHASHDLKSPLRSIMGLVEAAKESETLEESLTYIDLFQQASSRLELLVNDLLTLARSNRAEENTSLFDFSSELDGCLNMLTYMDHFKSIRIEKSIQQETPFYTDAVRLRIILNNLIGNAIKYHHPDQPEPYIHIRVTAGSAKAVIDISDNGEGISEHHLPRIFDMFYRASKHADGSGLGLYIVKSMVEKIGGTVTLTSTLHKGTTFQITLPNYSGKSA